MIIEIISPWLYTENQGLYEQMLGEAMEYSHRPEDTIDAVSEAVIKGTAMAVRVEYDDELLAVAVLEGMETKQGRSINIWALAGERVAMWIDDFLTFVDEVARKFHCQGVIMGGRPGWQKKLKPQGWSVQSVIMRKAL